MNSVDFVHLQCQSEYSVKNSLVRISNLIDSVKELGMKSVALTDDMSLFSAIKVLSKSYQCWNKANHWCKDFIDLLKKVIVMFFYFAKIMKDTSIFRNLFQKPI